jgi:hypothetical protein
MEDSMDDRIGAILQGAVAGMTGTLALLVLRTASERMMPSTMPPVRKDPGEFMVEKAEALLRPEIRERVPQAVEMVAAKSVAAGYGVTAGALYGALRPRGGNTLTDGALLGLGVWAAGYLGWLPAIGLMPPVAEQETVEALGPPIRHVLFGVATVATYRWLRRRK